MGPQFRIVLLSDRFSEEILSWSLGNLIISYHFITGQSFSKDKCYIITRWVVVENDGAGHCTRMAG